MRCSILLLVSALYVVTATDCISPDGEAPCTKASRKALAPRPAPIDQEPSVNEAVRKHEAKGDDDVEVWEIGLEAGFAAIDTAFGIDRPKDPIIDYPNYYVPKVPVTSFDGSASAAKSSARLGAGAIAGIVCGVCVRESHTLFHSPPCSHYCI